MCVLLLLLESSAMAENAKGKYIAIGFGSTSCDKYIEARTSTTGVDYSKHLGYVAWVAGYITAVNRRTPDVYDVLEKTDMDGALLWIENWCRTNPLELFATAVGTLTNELLPSKLR
jgi:hypothetical protein